MIKDQILKGSQVLDDAEGFSIDRSKYMNASTATSCIRKQWYERNSEVQPAQDWGFARRGKQGELYIVDCLRAAGAMVHCVGDEQESIVSDDHRISATPDGYMTLETGIEVGLEFKTIDPRTNRDRLPKPEHVTQLQIGMELAHVQPSPWWRPAYGVLIYMDASNYNDILEFRVERDTGILDAMKRRAATMLDATSDSKLDREGKRSGECKAYGGCPWAATCGVAGAADDSIPMSGSMLEAAVRAYMVAKADEDEASARKAMAAETIKQGMTNAAARQLQVGNHMVKLDTVAGRTTVDWKAAEKAGISLDAFKKIGQASERLTVS